MLGVAIGLIVANALGSQLALWFLGDWELDRTDLARVGAQVAGGALAAAVAVIPLAVAGPGTVAEQVSEPVLEGMMIVVTYVAARRAGKRRVQAIAAVLVVMAVVAVLMVVKALVAA